MIEWRCHGNRVAHQVQGIAAEGQNVSEDAWKLQGVCVCVCVCVLYVCVLCVCMCVCCMCVWCVRTKKFNKENLLFIIIYCKIYIWVVYLFCVHAHVWSCCDLFLPTGRGRRGRWEETYGSIGRNGAIVVCHRGDHVSLLECNDQETGSPVDHWLHHTSGTVPLKHHSCMICVCISGEVHCWSISPHQECQSVESK